MIGLEDRQALAQDIQIAQAHGARLQPACAIAGIDVRTLQRRKARAGLTAGDGRPQAIRTMPGHALSLDERPALLAVANEPRFASVPPARIVPMLADEGVYLGSESQEPAPIPSICVRFGRIPSARIGQQQALSEGKSEKVTHLLKRLAWNLVYARNHTRRIAAGHHIDVS